MYELLFKTGAVLSAALIVLIDIVWPAPCIRLSAGPPIRFNAVFITALYKPARLRRACFMPLYSRHKASISGYRPCFQGPCKRALLICPVKTCLSGHIYALPSRRPSCRPSTPRCRQPQPHKIFFLYDFPASDTVLKGINCRRPLFKTSIIRRAFSSLTPSISERPQR